GSFGDSTAVSPSFTYTQSGTYNVRLRVTDNGGVTDITTVTISAGSPPAATISSPAAGTSWKVGDAIAFAGSAVDDNGAAIPASSPQSQRLSNDVFGSRSAGGAQTHTITAPATATTYKATYSAATVGATLVGTETVPTDVDNNPAGTAEAFRTTASTTGPVS